MNGKIKDKIVLPVICAISAILLALVNQVTSPVIKDYEDSVSKIALQEVSNGYMYSDMVTVLDHQYVKYYYPLFNGNILSGYIFGLTTTGYGGEITLVAGFDINGCVISAKLLSNSETPGVGKKAENNNYFDMFIGKGSNNNPIPTSKTSLNSEELTLVSGATLTFSGISKALDSASDYIKTL